MGSGKDLRLAIIATQTENSSATLGRRMEQFQSQKPNDGVSNSDVVLKGTAQGFYATICFIFTRLDELWHANGEK